MQVNWVKIFSSMLLSGVIGFNLSACQSFIPKAQGLASQQWQAQSYQRQDQVDVLWKKHSFSFLLYQQQQGKELQLLALTLTGQQLFEIKFDGQNVKVEQRIEQMKLLPFDFVVRDILFATYPNFIDLKHKDVTSLKDQTTDTQQILIQQQKVLNIRYLADRIELDNLQVPYQMVFSQVANTLESND